MKLIQPRLPDMIVGETVRPKFKLATALGDATLTGASFCSDPSGLTFSNESYDGDSGKTAEVDIAASSANDYTVKGTVTLSSGGPRIFVAYLRADEVEC